MKAGAVRRVYAVVAALGTASIAASVLALGARLWWVAELSTHFRLQLFAAQLVLLAALLASRQRLIALGVALCAAANWSYLHPVVWPGGHTAARPGTQLGVMTVNVSARNDEADRLLAMIEREQPDLILVVEYTERWRGHLEQLHADYAYRKLVPDDGAFGLALLSRHPIEAASIEPIGTTAAIDAQIDGPNGPFRVLGVHLAPPMSQRLAAERNRQLTRLAERRAAIEGPLIVLGDFNVSPYSPYFADWPADAGLTDTLAGRGPSATWPTFMPLLGIPIDHCLVSPHFTVLGRRHLSAFGSDHYPVLVHLLHGTTS